MKRGFTILELLVSLVVLGTVGAIAVPNYYSSIEKTRKNEAVINLQAIYAAEKLYKLKNGVYWGTGGTDIATINTNLNLDLTAMDYASGISVSGNAVAFQASLKRTGKDTVYTIDQTGNIRLGPGGVLPGGGGGGGVEGGCKGCPVPN